MRGTIFAVGLFAIAGCDANLGTRSDAGVPAPVDAGTDAAHADDSQAAPDAWTPPSDDAWVAPTPDAWSSPCPAGPIDLHAVMLHANPPDLADWPTTTTITEVDFTNDGVHLEFDKRDGPSRWPDVVPPGWDGPLQYTVGMIECVDGQWHGSAVIEYWYGLDASGGNVALNDQIAMNWFYDAGRWGALAGRQPSAGEMVGIFVAAGNLRNITTDDAMQSPVMERSNVVLVPFPDVNGAMHSF